VASYVLVMCLMFHIDATLQVDWRVGTALFILMLEV